VTVPGQLQFDLDALNDLVYRLQDRPDHRRRDGATRLLVAMVRHGLDEKALIPAAAIALELDQPNHHPQKDR
jgi:hypothetical protein